MAAYYRPLKTWGNLLKYVLLMQQNKHNLRLIPIIKTFLNEAPIRSIVPTPAHH